MSSKIQETFKDYGKGTYHFAGKVVDAVAPYIPLFDIATKLIKEIIDLHDAAQYNKNTCARLMERVIDARGAIEKLQRTKKSNEEKFKDQNFYNTFQRFTNTLTKIKAFEEELSKMGNFRKTFEASLIKDKFISLTSEFDTAMRDLNFSMMVDNEAQRKRDFESLEEDHDEIKKLLIYTRETVIEKVEKVVQEVQVMKSQLEDKIDNIHDQLGDKPVFKPPKIDANQRSSLGELLIGIEELSEKYVERGALPKIYPDKQLDLDGTRCSNDYDDDFEGLTLGDHLDIKTIMPFDEGLKIHQQIRKNESSEKADTNTEIRMKRSLIISTSRVAS
ncbi:19618_t:CDS:2 [Dentiscutata erythropus]|uniref:19618_t:CDS:1 n=1 Tax=Dentiscutata erythropus TaxID=1348616 RepID=A0A9N9EKL1_9GLOM|nr:19618_t:CDS:2 [Dentiscutata erythropus]